MSDFEAMRANAESAGQPALTERQRAVLRHVVREYVATGRPVGSRTLLESSDIGVSAATIRNEMAALEELGYLEHLHTSGGRIPSARGYRYFVAHLMGDVELPSGEQRSFLEDGDEVTFRAHARRNGYVAIGFGECTGRIA